MHERRIPLTRPTTDHDELDEVAAVLASGHLTQGSKVADFESAVAALAGTTHAIATTSATTALHLSLAALGIGPGDDVLVPDYTFPATANVVVQTGARPILVDVDPMTFTMDPEDLERKVTPASQAVLPVHAFGLAADMDRIGAVSEAHGLALVEDAACALGTTYRGRSVGGFGAAGCFSFHPRKSITTGEGGMITTDDDDLAARIRLLRSHGGIREGNRFNFVEAGYNYRLSDIHAAIGIAQLRKLDRLLARRRSIADRYCELLANDSGVTPPHLPEWDGHVYQSFVVLLEPGVERDTVIRQLADDGIETTLGTYALHREPYFQRELGSTEADAPHSADVFRRALTLPLYPDMRDEDQDWVVARVRSALNAVSDVAKEAGSLRGSNSS